jgi:hypothetical protein
MVLTLIGLLSVYVKPCQSVGYGSLSSLTPVILDKYLQMEFNLFHLGSIFVAHSWGVKDL